MSIRDAVHDIVTHHLVIEVIEEEFKIISDCCEYKRHGTCDNPESICGDCCCTYHNCPYRLEVEI